VAMRKQFADAVAGEPLDGRILASTNAAAFQLVEPA
jgi:hypothetical protein